MKKLTYAIITILALSSATLFAQAPEAFNYQAAARDGSGNLLQNQPVSVIMGIYSGAAGAILVYEETHNLSTNDFGMFSLKIGMGTVNFGNFSDIEWGEDIYLLGVQIDAGGGLINLGKTQLISVPYAMHAKTVENELWQSNSNNIYFDAGKVGIGTSVPSNSLHVHTVSGPSYLSVSDGNSGVNNGVRLGTEGNGHAYLINDFASGDLSIGTNGSYDMKINADGMFGLGSDNPLVKMHVLSEDSPGVNGTDLGSQYSSSQDLSPAVYGRSTGSTADITYGVYGNAYSNDAQYSMGVFAEGGGATTNNYGLYAADFGEAGSNYSIAVYGHQSGNGDAGNYAGYFVGDVSVTGSLSKGGGSFKIDHPLDPANKYLYHSFVESPDMLNIYNGNVITNTNGIAVVSLPEYFETLNMDFRYQLTVIGEFADAIILEEISNNQFTIKTDKPEVKVSWLVTGVRQDPWANKNRIIPEVNKENVEKGKYLHPELYSRSEDEGLPTGILKITNNK